MALYKRRVELFVVVVAKTCLRLRGKENVFFFKHTQTLYMYNEIIHSLTMLCFYYYKQIHTHTHYSLLYSSLTYTQTENKYCLHANIIREAFDRVGILIHKLIEILKYTRRGRRILNGIT